MNNAKIKTILGIIASVLIISILLGMVVYIFMQSNKKSEDWELFIDTAPVNYGNDENYFSVMRFKDSTNNFIAKLFNGIDATILTERVIESMSKARIPAEKLGTMATAISEIDFNIIADNINNSDITEDNILDFMQKTTIEYISTSIYKFFSTSNLTEEEFSRFLYVYLYDWAPENYLLYLNILGKDNFIAFFSNSIYLINTLSEIKETGGKGISDYALRAVLYQLGSVYTNIIDTVGVDVIEKVLCFDWHFLDEEGNPNAIANGYYDNIRGRIGLIVGILGAVMQSTEIDTINAFRENIKDSTGKLKTDKQIYAQILMANTIKSGMLKLYTAKTGINNFDEMVSTYQSVMQNTILLNYVLAGGNANDEEILADCATISINMTSYSQAIKSLNDKNYTLAELESMQANEYYEELVLSAQAMSSMKYSVDYFLSTLINLWINYQTNVLNEMV